MHDGSGKGTATALIELPVEERIFATVGKSLLVSRKNQIKYNKILRNFRNLETNDAELISLLIELFSERNDHQAVLEMFDRYLLVQTWDYEGASNLQLGTQEKMLRLVVEAMGSLDEESRATDLEQMLSTSNFTNLSKEKFETWKAEETPIPDFEMPLLDGTIWRLEEHRGKIIVLNFWASWCGPCQKELPELEKWKNGHPDVEVIAVSMDNKEERARKGAKELKISLPVSHAPKLGRIFGIEALPSMRVIDQKGVLIYEGRGYSTKTFERLDSVVEKAEKEDSSKKTWATYRHFSDATLELQRYLPVVDLVGAYSDQDQVWLLREEGAPVLLPEDEKGLLDVALRFELQNGTQAAELDGAIIVDKTGLLLRKLEDNAIAWTLGFSSRIVALLVQNHKIWVATEDELIVLDRNGAVLERRKGEYLSLAVSDSGVWALMNGRKDLLQFSNGKIKTLEENISLGRQIDQFGGVSGLGVEQILWRKDRYGKMQQLFLRSDRVLVSLDSEGQIGFLLKLESTAKILSVNIDQDPEDELLVVMQEKGVAILDVIE